MSIIKDLYDVAKDGTSQAARIVTAKRVLKKELKLNKKCLHDIAKSYNVDDERRKQITRMLETNELSAAVSYEIPYLAISRRKVSLKLAEKYKIKRIEGYNLENLIESLFLLISYLKKDLDNERINLNLRLININKYNNVLLELLK